MADILHEAYEAPSYIKLLKSFGLDNKQTLSGWDKFGKNEVIFRIRTWTL